MTILKKNEYGNITYKILQILKIINTKVTNICYKCGSDKRTNKRKQSTRQKQNKFSVLKQNKQSVPLLYDINYHYLNSHIIIIINLD